jgi:hypothetical protein
MKIRQGFVSNSSSTSFTCDMCGENFAGMDLSVIDVEHYQCENGHIYCEEARLNNTKGDPNNEDDEDPIEHCPFCQMKKVAPTDINAYIFKKNGQTRQEIEQEMLSKFAHINDFYRFLKGNYEN